MCFCLLVELDVFVLFCTSSGNGNVFHQKLAFSWRGTKKTKKTKDFGLFVFFGFFGTSSGNGNVFHQKLAFSWRGTKKNKKTKILDSSGLAFAKTLKSLVFLVFLVPPQEMATLSTKSLHFPGGVPKKKSKILDSSALRQDSRIFGFFCFFGTSSGNGNVFHQKLAFSWRGTKKTKKNQDFGLFRPRLRQDSKIFGFFGFFGTSSGNGNVFHQKLAFSWKTKIFGFFGFFGTSSGNGNVFHQKLAFSWRGTKKTKKNKRFWTLQASPSPRL